MNWWQTILSTAAGGGFVTFLVFILSRTEKAAALAGTAIKSMGGSLTMQEKLRQALWQQSRALTAWEDWGRKIQTAWEQLIAYVGTQPGIDPGKLPECPRPPSEHPDLSKIFEEAEK